MHDSWKFSHGRNSFLASFNGVRNSANKIIMLLKRKLYVVAGTVFVVLYVSETRVSGPQIVTFKRRNKTSCGFWNLISGSLIKKEQVPLPMLLNQSTQWQGEIWMNEYSHNVAVIPEDGVSVEVCWGVKPEVHPLLSVSLAMSVHIRLHCVRLPWSVSQELKIQLISNRISLRTQLQVNAKIHHYQRS